MSDKDLERERYEKAARREALALDLAIGANDLAEAYRAPYVCYEQHLATLIRANDTVLELGAGSGRHTAALANTNARVIALDISSAALTVGQRRAGGKSNPVCGDMEALPLRDNSIDSVASAGSLSYGEPFTVDSEIFRVLRPGVRCCSLTHSTATLYTDSTVGSTTSGEIELDQPSREFLIQGDLPNSLATLKWSNSKPSGRFSFSTRLSTSSLDHSEAKRFVRI